MSILGHDADAARALLGGLVRPETLDEPAAAADRLARAYWSVLAEPGDSVAGQLVAELGAAAALDTVLDDMPGGPGARPPSSLGADDLARGRQRWRPRLVDVRHPLVVARHVNARLIVPGDPEWPERLDDLGAHAPLALWVRGAVAVLGSAQPAVAVVGARAATAYGQHAAAEIAGDLAAGGVDVVSGAAFGIDATAHRAALAVDGRSFAVLAGGVEKAYPSGHAGLLSDISARGVVLSEVPCGVAPTKWRFLQRNRLIAALADATVVVEAGWRSGSLNTAGHAAALGRPLGAVPGPITSAASAGCHRILREYDGYCITSADDVRDMLGLSASGDAEPSSESANGRTGQHAGERTDDRTRIIDALSTRSTRTVSDVARRAGVGPDEAAALLGLLALEGRASREGNGWRAERS